MSYELIRIIAIAILGAVFGKLLSKFDLLPQVVRDTIHLIIMAAAIILIIQISTQMIKT